MLIRDVIATIKQHCKGWGEIDEATTKDQVIFGELDKECTGIVTTIYPSIAVIEKAHQEGANLIVSHEATFWNRGDKQDWLADYPTYQEKAALLKEYGITVWRFHDYIHSGVPWQGEWVDGIFYGLISELEWEPYVAGYENERPHYIRLPKTPTRELAQYIIDKFNYNGLRCVGDLDGYSENIMIATTHVFGPKENDDAELRRFEEHNIDTYLSMELTDFTLSIFIKDSASLGHNRRALCVGHFNLEEPGMKWCAEKYFPTILPDIKATFAQAGDHYKFITK